MSNHQASESRKLHRLLYNGGDLYVNPCGTGWTVDVFQFGSAPADDPVYHAYYASRDEAVADADLWQPWEGDQAAAAAHLERPNQPQAPIRSRRIDGQLTYWRDGGGVSTRLAGPSDFSPTHTGYDPECAACWLNHSHSEAFHTLSLEVAR